VNSISRATLQRWRHNASALADALTELRRQIRSATNDKTGAELLRQSIGNACIGTAETVSELDRQIEFREITNPSTAHQKRDLMRVR
jgi:predicted site-specific integrase-resolvase